MMLAMIIYLIDVITAAKDNMFSFTWCLFAVLCIYSIFYGLLAMVVDSSTGYGKD